MRDRYYYMVLTNATILFLTGVALAPGAQHLGNALIGGISLLLSICLFIVAPNFRDRPPTYEEVKKMEETTLEEPIRMMPLPKLLGIIFLIVFELTCN